MSSFTCPAAITAVYIMFWARFQTSLTVTLYSLFYRLIDTYSARKNTCRNSVFLNEISWRHLRWLNENDWIIYDAIFLGNSASFTRVAFALLSEKIANSSSGKKWIYTVDSVKSWLCPATKSSLSSAVSTMRLFVTSKAKGEQLKHLIYASSTEAHRWFVYPRKICIFYWL